MAKKRFRSCNLKIEVAYNDRGHYQVRLCPIRPQGRCEKVKVGVPKSYTRAVDSDDSLRAAARAAISFARDDIQDQACMDSSGSEWGLRGSRRRKRR